jgi:hypothetical protein
VTKAALPPKVATEIRKVLAEQRIDLSHWALHDGDAVLLFADSEELADRHNFNQFGLKAQKVRVADV